MEEKIREAVEDEASRISAISEAAGVLPRLRDRVREDAVTHARFMLVLDEKLTEPHGAPWWEEFARMDRAEFEKPRSRPGQASRCAGNATGRRCGKYQENPRGRCALMASGGSTPPRALGSWTGGGG
jgi:hypothetical protein